MTDPATSFGSVAATYDRARPSYPQALVDWLAPQEAKVVVDAGAGTGKLTAALLAPGRRIVAVDPDPAMLSQLAQRFPGVDGRAGRGEELPLENDSVDLVVFAQAWHWADPATACAEVARVLQIDGAIGLIWNIRDESVDWVGALSDVIGRSLGERVLDQGGPDLRAPFGAPEHRQHRWSLPLSVDGLVDLVASRSTVITAAADVRAEMLRAARDIAERAAGDDGVIEMPYVTHAFRTRAT